MMSRGRVALRAYASPIRQQRHRSIWGWRHRFQRVSELVDTTFQHQDLVSEEHLFFQVALSAMFFLVRDRNRHMKSVLITPADIKFPEFDDQILYVATRPGLDMSNGTTL